jgi:trk system potassium uptake protein TrkA
MRIVFVGGSSLAVAAARILTERGHEVVIIDADREKLDALGEELDIGLLHGDGTRPDLLRDADPGGTDCLFCLTESDQSNLIASLVGRSLGFRRVVTRIEDAEFEHIALELGLEDTVVPARTIGRHLADMVEGSDSLELSAAIKGDACVFVFVAREEDAGSVEELGLPELARATHLYRGGRFRLIDPASKVAAGDEVVVISDAKNLEALHKRWGLPGDRRDAGAARPGDVSSSS